MAEVLDKLIRDYLRHEIDGEVFSAMFEHEYNFNASVSSRDRDDQGYRKIFDASSLFTTIEDEKKIYPGYVIETELLRIVEDVARSKSVL